MSNWSAVEQSQRHQEFCPLDATLEILAGKWKSIIICRLMNQELRFSELLIAIPNCTKRMLALQLKQLIGDHIVTKTVTKINQQAKITYTLSKDGQSLLPIVLAMNIWGTKYVSKFKLTERQ